jgi:hypothetical protein
MAIPPSDHSARSVSEQIQKDRQELGRLVRAGKRLASGNRRLVGILNELQLVSVNALQAMLVINTLRISLEERWANRNRQPDHTRMDRGKIVAQANHDGISWKNIPSHVLKTYPDWFPQYQGRRLTLEERKTLEERLRKMARDAEKREKK